MKKKLKKLQLSRETLSSLDSERLVGVEGAVTTLPCTVTCDTCGRTICNSCPRTVC